MVVVFRFKVFDPKTNAWVVELSKGTLARIANLGGQIVSGTAEEVDVSLIDGEGRYCAPASDSPQ